MHASNVGEIVVVSPTRIDVLVEIAGVIEHVMRERLMSAEKLGTGRCRRLAEIYSSKLQYIVLDLMRKDPIGAYAEILPKVRHVPLNEDASFQETFVEEMSFPDKPAD